MRREGFLFRSSKRVRAVLIPGETVKKSLKPLHAPPPKLSSPMKTAMRAASHALALGVLLVSGAVWTISQQHPLYANPGKLLRLPAAIVDASQPTEQAFRIGEVLNQYTHDRALAFRIADALVEQADKEHIDPALLVGVLLTEDATLDPHARSSGWRARPDAGHAAPQRKVGLRIVGPVQHREQHLSRCSDPEGSDAQRAEYARGAPPLQRLCPRTQHSELPPVRRQGSETRGACRRGDAAGPKPRRASKVVLKKEPVPCAPAFFCR